MSRKRINGEQAQKQYNIPAATWENLQKKHGHLDVLTAKLDQDDLYEGQSSEVCVIIKRADVSAISMFNQLSQKDTVNAVIVLLKDIAVYGLEDWHLDYVPFLQGMADKVMTHILKPALFELKKH